MHSPLKILSTLLESLENMHTSSVCRQTLPRWSHGRNLRAGLCVLHRSLWDHLSQEAPSSRSGHELIPTTGEALVFVVQGSKPPDVALWCTSSRATATADVECLRCTTTLCMRMDCAMSSKHSTYQTSIYTSIV